MEEAMRIVADVECVCLEAVEASSGGVELIDTVGVFSWNGTK